MDKNLSIKNIFCIVAPRIDLLNRIFSLGLDSLWRKRLISLSGIKVGDTVLDACTGTGEIALLIEKKVRPSGTVTGVDFCEEMLEIARRKTNSHKKNISFILSDIRTFPFPDNTFDAVTVGFGMRNIADTVSALREIKRVIKPGGRFFCLELTMPEKKWFLPLYKLYVFKIIPFLGKIAI
ncbi:MAG: ubiquinone/menaquinone biosynthesis methyltransferase, partial [Nitrospirae bacterium]|nr:ubiquinone/menaquinone biosynthesis methyltransferase [Nitrospirota bacterium]